MALTKIDDRGLKTPIDLIDNEKIRLGTGNDLNIYHDGTNSYIDNNSGSLIIDGGINTQFTNVHGEDTAKFIANGAVELYYDNSKKAETASWGLNVLGNCGVGDSSKFQCGDSQDLQIYHDGSQSYITNATSDLRIRSGYVKLQGSNGEDMLIGNQNTSVELYYDNVKTFETTSNGITVQGPEGGTGVINLYADEGDDNADKWHFLANTDDTLLIRNLSDASWDTNIKCVGGGSTELYYDDSKKFETTSSGIKVSGNIDIDDSNKLRVGTSSDLEIYHDGTHSYIKDTGPGDLRIQTDHLDIINAANTEQIAKFVEDGAVELYYNGQKQIETIGSGVRIPDSKGYYCGDGDDLKMFFNGTDGFIRAEAGKLNLDSSGGEKFLIGNPNGAVELYYDNVKKLETTNTGAKISGSKIEVINTASAGDAQLYLEAGEGGTAFIQFIADNGDDNTDKSRILQGDGGNLTIQNYDSGSWATKFETTSDGVTLTGDVFFDNATNAGNDITWDMSDNLLEFTDDTGVSFGDGKDLQIYHDGSNSYIENSGTGSLNLYGDDLGILNKAKSEWKAKFISDGGVELYYDNSKKLSTSSAGVVVDNGTMRCNDGFSSDTNLIFNSDANANGASAIIFKDGGNEKLRITGGNISLPDSSKIMFGENNDLYMYHNGTSSFIDNGTGHLYIRGNSEGDVGGNVYIQALEGEHGIALIHDHAVYLYFNNAEKLRTSASGITVQGSVTTEDINMSNLNAITPNEVDGTRGSWTMQEGADDLFLINRANGKKYKFNLTEVS